MPSRYILGHAPARSLMQRLSSSATPFYKIILPTLWAVLFGSGAVQLALGHTYPPASPAERLGILALWVAGLGLFCWLCLPLKNVSLGPKSLHVSGLFKKTEIPLAEIERVSGTVFISPDFITVTLKRPGVFGSRFRFMPRMRIASLSAHPTVALLEQRAAARQNR